MERALKLLRESKVGSECLSAEQLARAAWNRAVGPRLSAKLRPVRLIGGRLVVEVEDDVWRRQMIPLARQIVAKIDTALGPGIVSSLDFCVGGVPRRGPARENAPVRSADEADQIADPVLSRIYRAHRKKASA